MKKIYRSEDNKIIAGIFGGLGEYLDIDPVILRLIGLLVCFLTAVIPFLLAYVIAIFIIPRKK